jgi:archaellin
VSDPLGIGTAMGSSGVVLIALVFVAAAIAATLAATSREDD